MTHSKNARGWTGNSSAALLIHGGKSKEQSQPMPEQAVTCLFFFIHTRSIFFTWLMKIIPKPPAHVFRSIPLLIALIETLPVR